MVNHWNRANECSESELTEREIKAEWKTPFDDTKTIFLISPGDFQTDKSPKTLILQISIKNLANTLVNGGPALDGLFLQDIS